MTNGEDKWTGLVPVQSTALARIGANSLATRARADLRVREDAQEWLRKGLELQRAAPADPRWGSGPLNPYAKKPVPRDFQTQLELAAKYIKRVLAGGFHPDVAAESLGMSFEDQELAHVAHFFMPNELAEAVGDFSGLAPENSAGSAQPIAAPLTSEPSTASPTIPSPAGMDDGVLSKATMEIVGKLILEFERIKQEKHRRGEQLQQRIEMLKEAFQCFEKGHQLDPMSPELLYWLAEYYRTGEGVQENEERALALFKTAADMGYAGAQTALGDAYSQIGFSSITEDLEQAARYYEAAADQGDEEALGMLVGYCQGGIGVKQDHTVAAKLLREAAARGNQDAKHNLKVFFKKFGAPYGDNGGASL